MMAHRQSRRYRRRPNRKNSNARTLTIALLAGVSLIALSGGGYLVYADMQTAKPDEMGCYITNPDRPQTVVLVDSSDPGFDPVQSRDLINGIGAEFEKLGFNEGFSVITTQENRIGSIPDPVVSLCGPARSSSDLEGVGASSATLAYIQRQAEKTYTEALLPVLQNVFSPDLANGDRQRHESPILEQIQSVSRMPSFSAARDKHLILVSDLLHNTLERQFCVTQGHLPSFAKFKSSAYFGQVQPSSLSGTDVTIYMPIRGQLGREPYPYCTEDELRAFWRDYFTDVGARNVEFIRIRHGYSPEQ